MELNIYNFSYCVLLSSILSMKSDDISLSSVRIPFFSFFSYIHMISYFAAHDISR
jgi:hypothetical protein